VAFQGGSGEGGGPLAPGARDDKDLGSATPMLVKPFVGLSAASPGVRDGATAVAGPAGATVKGVGIARQEALSGRVWPASGRRTRGFALTHRPVLLYSSSFFANFSRRTKRSAGASIPRRI
jgi:hypothetical protein